MVCNIIGCNLIFFFFQKENIPIYLLNFFFFPLKLGYIIEHGYLNLRRFARLLHILKPKDFDLYRENIEQKPTNICKQMAAVNLNDDQKSTNGCEIKVSFSDFLEMKDNYYAEHLGHTNLPDFQNMSFAYVKTIQWILLYYFRGTASWNHYYPYKCAPFVSDFTAVHQIAFSLDLEKPVKAFTHLLAILPKSSAHLLPACYQPSLMDDEIVDMVRSYFRFFFLASFH